MSDTVLIVLGTAILNGAVTWGVISTKLAWFRRDLDDHHRRLTWLEQRAAALKE